MPRHPHDQLQSVYAITAADAQRCVDQGRAVWADPYTLRMLGTPGDVYVTVHFPHDGGGRGVVRTHDLRWTVQVPHRLGAARDCSRISDELCTLPPTVNDPKESELVQPYPKRYPLMRRPRQAAPMVVLLAYLARVLWWRLCLWRWRRKGLAL